METFKNEMIAEFNENREANIKELLIFWSAGCGDKTTFLKAAMTALVSEEGIEFCKYNDFRACLENAAMTAVFDLNPAEKAACHNQFVKEENERLRNNRNLKTYRQFA